MCQAEIVAVVFMKCLTPALIKACQRKHGIDADRALQKLQQDIKDFVTARVERDNWLDFIDRMHENEVPQPIINAAFDAAVESWRRGYVAGFIDYNELSIMYGCEAGKE